VPSFRIIFLDRNTASLVSLDGLPTNCILGATGGGENLHLIYIPWWQVYWSVFYIAKLKIAAPGVSYKRKDAYLQIVESDKVKSTITAEKKHKWNYLSRGTIRAQFFRGKTMRTNCQQ